MNTIDRKKVSAHFKRSISTYDKDAVVQKEVSANLISLLENYSDIHFNRVLEIGCCTGSMTEELCQHRPVKQLWLNDLVDECTHATAERIASCVERTHLLPGDISTISLPDNLDLVISSSTFQWIEDLPGIFDRFAEVLNDTGALVFSMFAKGTMQQVRELLGVGLSYLDEKKLADILQPHFNIEHIATSSHRLYLGSPREVLRHIQQTGVGGAGDFCWTPSKLRKFENDYIGKFGNEQGVPLDYVSITVVAKKTQTIRMTTYA